MISNAPAQARTGSATATGTARKQLLGWGLLMLGIYAVYLWAFPLIPTIQRPGPMLDIELMLRQGRHWFIWVFIAGLACLFFAYWRMIRLVHIVSRDDPQAAKSLRLWVLGIGLACGVLLLGLYPITAIDVAGYVVRARLWAVYGQSPMVAVPAAFPQDPYVALTGEFSTITTPYGPVWEFIAQIPVRLGITDITGGIISMKVISLMGFAGMAWLIGWRARQDDPERGVSSATALAFFALNPALLMEVIGNGHNDILMLLFITLGLVLWQRGHWAWAALAVTAAMLVKAPGLILLPLLGIAVLLAADDWRTRIWRAAGMAAIILGATLISYRLMGPFPDVFQGAIHASIGRRGFSPAYFVYVLAHTFFPGHSNQVFNGFLFLFVLYYVYVVVLLWKRKISLIEAGFMAYFAQVLLSAAFRIWYPLWLVPFAALNLNSRTFWRTFLFSLTAELSILSYFVWWRWVLRYSSWAKTGPLARYWDYWTVMTLVTVPWTFGIPFLGDLIGRWRDRARFEESLWL
jgi:hypothetical protein